MHFKPLYGLRSWRVLKFDLAIAGAFVRNVWRYGLGPTFKVVKETR